MSQVAPGSQATPTHQPIPASHPTVMCQPTQASQAAPTHQPAPASRPPPMSPAAPTHAPTPASHPQAMRQLAQASHATPTHQPTPASHPPAISPTATTHQPAPTTHPQAMCHPAQASQAAPTHQPAPASHPPAPCQAVSTSQGAGTSIVGMAHPNTPMTSAPPHLGPTTTGLVQPHAGPFGWAPQMMAHSAQDAAMMQYFLYYMGQQNSEAASARAYGGPSANPSIMGGVNMPVAWEEVQLSRAGVAFAG